jgi:hypothetical protein
MNSFHIYAIISANGQKNKRSIITTLVMLALVPLSYKYYNMLSIDSFSYVNMAVYYAVIILLTSRCCQDIQR